MLTLRKTWPGEHNYQDDYMVLEDGLSIGRIYLSKATWPPQWLWFINVNDPKKTRNGIAASLDDAKTDLKAKWAEVRDAC